MSRRVLRSVQQWLPYRHQRLLLILAGSTAIVVGITAHISYQAVRKIVLQNITHNALLAVQHDVKQVDHWLAERRAEVEAIANSPTARSLDWEQIEPYLQAERERLPHFHLLALLDQQGRYYTDRGQSGDASDREFFQRAIRGEANVSSPIVSRSTGVLQVSFAAPIYAPAPRTPLEVLGVIACPVSVAHLTEIVDSLAYREQSYAFALDRHGAPVVYPEAGQLGADQDSQTSWFRARDHNLAQFARQMVKTKEPTIQPFVLEGEAVYVAYMPLQQVDWWVALVIPRANIDGQLASLNRLAILISGLLATLVGVALLGVASLRDRTLLHQLRCELRDRQEAEAALRISEERFRQLAENMREIVYLFAADFQETLYINPAYEVVSGYPLTSVCRGTRAWFKTVHPDDRERLQQAFATPESRAHINIEYRLCRADGDIRWLHMRNFPICNGSGEVYRIAGIAEDITDRKQAEMLQAEMQAQLELRVQARTAELSQANRHLQVEISERERAEQELRLLEERFRALFNQAPVGIAACDVFGYCVDANPALCQILATDPQTLSIYRLPDLLTDTAVSDCKMYFTNLARRKPQPPLICEQRCRRLDGREIWISLTLAPLTAAAAGQKLRAIAVIENITERKATEERKEEFLAVASHELRTPLTTVHSSLELMAAGHAGCLDERGQQLLKFARLDTERLIRLANKLLHYERLHFGRANSELQWCDVKSLVENACRATSQQAAAAQVRVELDLDADSAVYGDRDSLTRALTNLLENAIKFSQPDSQVWLRVKAENSRQSTAKVHFQVEDAGTGIAPELLERIFQPFERGSEPARTAQTGAGLGLAICQQIVQHHGSQLQVKSRLGEGSCFFFSLYPPPNSPAILFNQYYASATRR